MEKERVLSRRERERIRHRGEILEAAKRIFVESGYNSATMDAIASESEFSLATLYKFFGSKENLFVEILLQMMEKLENQTEEILTRNSSCRQRAIDLFKARLDLHWDNPGLVSLVQDVIRNHHGELDCLVDLKKRYISHVKRMAMFFSEGITRGEFRDQGGNNLALVYEGVLHMYFGSTAERKMRKRDLDEEDALLSIFLDGAATPSF